MVNKQRLKFSKKLLIALSNIIFEELEDPVFKRVSINHIKLNEKGTIAIVYIDLINAGEKANVIKKLNLLKIFLQIKLIKKLKIYKSPFLSFKSDEFLDQAIYITKLIEEDKKYL